MIPKSHTASFKGNTHGELICMLQLIHNVQDWVWLDLKFYISFYIFF